MIKLRPFELEHVELELDSIPKLPVFVAVVDAVLWWCCPKSLTLEYFFPSYDFEEWINIFSVRIICMFFLNVFREPLTCIALQHGFDSVSRL